MSTNCLITKLKGSVDNDNLPVFGYFVVDVADGSVVRLTFSGDFRGKEFRLTGNIHLCTNATSGDNIGTTKQGINGVNELFISSGEGKVFVPKYIATTIVNAWPETEIPYESKKRISFNIEDVVNYQPLDRLVISYFNCYGDISKAVATDNLTELTISYCERLTGDVSGLIKDISSLNFGHSHTSLDISRLSNLNNLTNISFGDNFYGDISALASIPNNLIIFKQSDGITGITGNITDFVAAAITKRKSLGQDGSGSITVGYPLLKLPNVTWPSGMPNASGVTISWDAEGNITWTSE